MKEIQGSVERARGESQWPWPVARAGKFILCLGCWVSSETNFLLNGVYPSGNKLLEQRAVTFQ